MLIPIAGAQASARLHVFAYDIASPRRARRARGILEPLQHARQKSVFEVVASTGAGRGILAELAAVCEPAEDSLAVWFPAPAGRLQWMGDRFIGHDGTSRAARGGNFVVCYDIADPLRLRAVSRLCGESSLMVQRSVYWWRCDAAVLSRALATSRACFHEHEDRLWAYPLANADALWRVRAGRASVLPLSAHGWGS